MIDIKNLNLSFGERVIFKNANIQIPDNARLGIVGNNGTGKTTLLKIIFGLVEPDNANAVIARSKNLNMGYLPQDLTNELEPVALLEYLKSYAGILELENKLRDVEHKLSLAKDVNNSELENLLNQYSNLERQFENAGGFEFDSMCLKILHGLGFVKGDEFKRCDEFSGGWKMRIALAAILVSPHNMLLLDEPTNHLDTESMEWLENWLRNFKGGVIAISHDRRFLDNIAAGIADIENNQIVYYPYDYENYLLVKEKNSEILEKNFIAQQNKIQKIESFITRFRYKATKAAQVQSRIKQLEKIKRIELNSNGHEKILKLDIPEAPASGLEVLKVEKLAKNYDGKNIFHDVNFILNRGERVALVGVNGAGKSTLLRLISLNESPDSGIIKYGHNVKAAYFSQESAKNLDYKNTVWDEAKNVPSKLNEPQRRNLLGAFLFSGDDIFKQINILSGGEKARLALYKLMLAETNFLILDEPTNHLDQSTREIVERALLKYQGTLLIVSHDRHFLDNLAERVLEIRDGVLYDYLGNYSWFLEKRESVLNSQSENSNATVKNLNPAKKSKPVFSQDKRALKKQIAELEKKISDCEQKISDIDTKLCDPKFLNNSNEIQKLMIERKSAENILKDLYSEWENNSSKLEQQK